MQGCSRCAGVRKWGWLSHEFGISKRIRISRATQKTLETAGRPAQEARSFFGGKSSIQRGVETLAAHARATRYSRSHSMANFEMATSSATWRRR